MMTEYSPRLFADDAAVRRVGEGLLSRTLPREEWTHEAHLAACLWLLSERSDFAIETALPGTIRRYNESVGGVNDDTQGYHETLTQLYIAGVRAWLCGDHLPATLVDRVNALLASPIGERSWPLTLYSHQRLFSLNARRALVPPDLGEWPGDERR
ncbi:MAG: hypothetical protein ABL874_05525 [Sphingopyxis sp.]